MITSTNQLFFTRSRTLTDQRKTLQWQVLHLRACAWKEKYTQAEICDFPHAVSPSGNKNWLIDSLKNGEDGGRLCGSLLLIWSSHCKRWKMCKLAKWDTDAADADLTSVKSHTCLPGQVQSKKDVFLCFKIFHHTSRQNINNALILGHCEYNFLCTIFTLNLTFNWVKSSMVFLCQWNLSYY